MKITNAIYLLAILICFGSCAEKKKSKTGETEKKETEIKLSNKEIVLKVFDAIGTGDPAALDYYNDKTYIQHNLGMASGKEAVGGFFSGTPSGVTVKNHFIFEDGDYVVTLSTYGGAWGKMMGTNSDQVGYDVFKFDDGQMVEHWDNLANVTGPNPSNRLQTDNITAITDKHKTAANKELVSGFINNVLISGGMDKVTSYINPEKYLQHNSGVADGLDGFGAAMKSFAQNGMVMQYTKHHETLGEGNYVLSISEGNFGKTPGDLVAYYDLFKVEDGLIVEHWDVIQTIPAKADWKNDNGKFGF